VTCADALPLLLDADLAALAVDRASPLGAHVAGCARCRSVVAALQADTSRLATLAAAHPAPAARTPRADRRRPLWLAPIPIAAAIALAYLGLARIMPTSVAPTVAPAARISDSPASAPAAAATEHAAPRAARRLARAKAPPRTAAHTSAPTAVAEGRRSTPAPIDVGGPTIAQSAAPTPVAYDAGLTEADLAAADVSTAGGRVVVLRPSNTNITVVWFY